MELHLEKLSSVELKNLVKAVEAERKRRSSRSPDNHEAPVWNIPTTAMVNGHESVPLNPPLELKS